MPKCCPFEKEKKCLKVKAWTLESHLKEASNIVASMVVMLPLSSISSTVVLYFHKCVSYYHFIVMFLDMLHNLHYKLLCFVYVCCLHLFFLAGTHLHQRIGYCELGIERIEVKTKGISIKER